MLLSTNYNEYPSARHSDAYKSWGQIQGDHLNCII